MKKIITRMLPLFLLLTLLTVFASPVAFAAETGECEHVWNEGEVTQEATCSQEGIITYTCTKCGDTKTETIAKTEHTIEMEVITEATAKTRGQAYKKCAVCGRYARGSSTIRWVEGNDSATKFNYYKPYTLFYRSQDGTETQLPGTFRGVSATNDFYGDEDVTKNFPAIPNPDDAPIGYYISPYAACKYAVLVDGGTIPFTPGNSATSVSYGWLNDTDTKYTIVSVFVIETPQVSIAQDGAVLTAEIGNWNENLAYTYQWYKNGEAIEGATESTCPVTEKCYDASAEYSVTVNVKSAEDSKIYTLNPTQTETATSEVLDANCPHVWDEGTVTKEPSCTTTGTKVYTCTNEGCTETKTETLPMTEHIEKIEIVKEATAKTRGELYIKCSSCGRYKKVSGSSVSWLTSSKKATKFYYYKPYTLIYRSLDGTETQVPGTFRGVSSSNDYYGSEGVTLKFPEMPFADNAPTGYYISTFESNRYAVLVDGGTKSFTPGNDATSVSYGWLNDTDYTYYIISLFAMSQPEVSISQDGAVLTAEIGNWNENLAYTYQWYKNGEAIEGATEKTCTITEKCTEESAKYTVQVSVTSAEDSTIPTLNPTHSETATSEVYTAEPVHTPIEIPGVAATCTEDGLTAGSKCTTCDEILVEQEVIPATGHTVVTDPAVPATCEETGLTEGSHCSVCGEVFTAQETIPALGHKYGAWKDSEDGKTHIRVCANDPTHVLSENHTYGEWTVTKEATATEKGSKERECSVCGYKQTVSIPALDPAPKTGDETHAPAYILLAVISLMGIVCLTMVIKKKS